MSRPPVFSIIIPAFNRIEPLLQTLQSVRAACERLGEPAEIILVDDGSEPPLQEVVPALAMDPLVRLIRQSNRGSMVARLTGLEAARGEWVLFLDSDDLIAEEKLLLHAEKLRSSGAVASYDDIGEFSGDPGSPIRLRQQLAATDSLTELVLRIQPPPHGCIYRRDFLQHALTTPVLPIVRQLDPVGDIWIYYNLSIHQGKVVKVDAPLSLIGIHDADRYSQSWEKLGVAALRTVELFMNCCPRTSSTEEARRTAGEVSFVSWRKLPRDFSPEYCRRALDIWHQAPPGRLQNLGGPLFRIIARVLGPLNAGRLLRLRNHDYHSCRSLSDTELEALLHQEFSGGRS